MTRGLMPLCVMVFAFAFLVLACAGQTHLQMLTDSKMTCIPAYTGCLVDRTLNSGGFLTMTGQEINDLFFARDLGGPASSIVRKLQTKQGHLEHTPEAIYYDIAVTSDMPRFGLRSPTFEFPAPGSTAVWRVPFPFLYLQWTADPNKRVAHNDRYHRHMAFSPEGHHAHMLAGRRESQYLDPWCRVDCVRAANMVPAAATLALGAQNQRVGARSPLGLMSQDLLREIHQYTKTFDISFTCTSTVCPNTYLQAPRSSFEMIGPKVRVPNNLEFTWHFCTTPGGHRIAAHVGDAVNIVLIPVATVNYATAAPAIVPDLSHYSFPMDAPPAGRGTRGFLD